MSEHFLYIDDIIKKVTGSEPPEFDVCSGSVPSFKLLRLQCKSDVYYNEKNGPAAKDERHKILCRDFISIAYKLKPDVLLTPEYSIPLDLILEIIENNSKANDVPQGKLWCLCFEGCTYEHFIEFIQTCESKGSVVIKDALECANISNFIGGLVYLFTLKDNRICIIPQLKTIPSADRKYLCESEGMCCGNIIYKFGKYSTNQLLTIICSDALNSSIFTLNTINPNGRENIILLHPQLNLSPRNKTFSALRNYILYSNMSCNELRYITSNWAYGTKLIYENPDNERKEKEYHISNPWSCIYFKNLNRDWIEHTRELRKLNFQKGLIYGFFDELKVNVWHCSKDENIQFIIIKKPRNTCYSALNSEYEVLVENIYIPEDNEWCESKNLNIPNNLESKLIHKEEIYSFPLEIDKEKRDVFFGICLGNSEKDQLTINGDELCMNTGQYIDDESENLRIVSIQNFNVLISYLKSEEMPNRFESLVLYHKFGLVDKLFNLVSSNRSDDFKAIIAFVPKESDAKRVSNDYLEKCNLYKQNFNMIDSISGNFITDKEGLSKIKGVCVFTLEENTNKLKKYPEYNYDNKNGDYEPNYDITMG